MSENNICLSDITLAATRIRDHVVRTPLMRSAALSRSLGRDVFLKIETVQPTGSFKLRGAANAVQEALEKHPSLHVVCSSTGNHGRAVAYMAERLGVMATICMPVNVPSFKRERIEEFGANVVLTGHTQDEAQDTVCELVAREGMIEIPPFDSKPVICGQGTVGLEIIQERPSITTILSPLSGGGLIGGIGVAVKAFDPHIRVIAATLERGSAMAESIRAGHPVSVPEYNTVAEALSGGIGLDNSWTFGLCRDHVDHIIHVPERLITQSVSDLFREHRLVTEGAGAIAVAALKSLEKSGGDIAVVISGNNVDHREFLELIGDQ